MPKIEVNVVAEICKRQELEPEKLRAIVEEMNLLVQPETDEEKIPAVKKQWAILISDPDGRLPTPFEFAGWVLQLPENENNRANPQGGLRIRDYEKGKTHARQNRR